MFSTLCSTLERMVSSKSKKDKLNIWLKYYNEQFSQTGFSAYDTLRLVLPKFDKARSSYGLKENSLARKYIDCLCIGKGSNEAQRLLKYKTIKGTRDFPESLYCILRQRCQGILEFSLVEINSLLDGIEGGTEQHNDKVNSFIDKVVRDMSPIHQKWLCRMILKELHIGVSEKSILCNIDSNAEAAFNVCSDLKKICDNLGNLSVLCGDIALGRVFKPMLADRISNLSNVEKLMKGKSFYVETKYDGERMQIHKKGEDYLYFSRGCKEYSDVYGATKNTGTLTPQLHSLIDANSCILDGEIIVYDVLNKELYTKAQGIDARNISSTSSGFLPCFVAFDVVYYNDSSLTMTPFAERRKILERIVKEKEGYFYLSKQSSCSYHAEVLDELNRAIDKGDEGLVLKVPTSIYSPDQRVDGGWYKVKPDYLELMNDTIDVVIIGGYYGRNSGSGTICHYLCGLWTASGEYSSFCKVSSGITKSDLSLKLSKLEPYWIPFQKGGLPNGVILSEKCREKPAVVIDPNHSMVIEIRAAELMGTGYFALPITARFPRVVRVRDDKAPSDCTKYSELQKMKNVNKRGIGKVELNPIGSPNKKPCSFPRTLSVVKKEVVVVKSTELMDKEFCVLSSSDLITKQEAELFVREHSGAVVSTPIPHCTVICGKHSISVQNIIKQGKHLVIDISWVKLCSKKVVPCPPHLVKFCPKELKEETFSSFDEHGDSYTVPVSPADLKELFERRPASDAAYSVNQEAFLDFKRRYSSFSNYWRFSLKEILLYTTEKDSKSAVVSLAKLYGARTTLDEHCTNVTHRLTTGDQVIEGDLPGIVIGVSDLLERLKPHVSDETYSSLHVNNIESEVLIL